MFKWTYLLFLLKHHVYERCKDFDHLQLRTSHSLEQIYNPTCYMNPGDYHRSKTCCECLEPYGVYKACWNFILTFSTFSSLWLTLTHYSTWQMPLNHIFTVCACCELDLFWRKRLKPYTVLFSTLKFLKESSLLQYWLKPSSLWLQFIAAIFPICYYQFQLLINMHNRTEIAFYIWTVFVRSSSVLYHLEMMMLLLACDREVA